MRHIAVPGFGTAPCNGLVEESARPPAPSPPAGAPRHRSLAIVGADGRPLKSASEQAATGASGTVVWICRGCGKTWEREPLLDEVL